jgi:hypothetical protein
MGRDVVALTPEEHDLVDGEPFAPAVPWLELFPLRVRRPGEAPDSTFPRYG